MADELRRWTSASTAARCCRRVKRAGLRGAAEGPRRRARRPLAPAGDHGLRTWPSTCRRWSTCGSTPTLSGSASSEARPRGCSARSTWGCCASCARAGTRRRHRAAVQSLARSGEHGLLWHLLSGAAWLVDRRGAARVRAGDAHRAGHDGGQHRGEADGAAGAAGARTGCRRSPPPVRALLPVGPRLHVVRGRAGALRAPAGAAALRAGLRDGAVAPLPGRALPVRHRRGRAARATPWPASAHAHEGRASSGCPTRASPRSSTRSPRRRAGGELSLHDGGAERGRGAGAGRAPRPGGGHDPGARHGVRDDRVPRHRRPRARRAPRARGSATSSWGTSARRTRSCTSCACTTTRRWCTRRDGWIRCPTWTRWTRSCCTPIWSRPSAGSSG